MVFNQTFSQMRTIKLQFESNGETIRRTAILTDDLSDLSKSKKNQATDITEYPEDSFWSVLFSESESLEYEVEFAYEDYCKTLEPIKAITWVDGVIDDVQEVSII